MSPVKHHRRRRLGAILAAGSALAIGIGVIIGNQITGGGNPAGTANLWVDTNGGTCTRSSTAVAYVDADACAGIAAAEAAARSGTDTVLVQCGTYANGTQTMAANSNITSGQVDIQPVTDKCVTVNGLIAMAQGAANFKLSHFVFINPNGVGIGETGQGTASTPSSSNIALDSNDIQVGQAISGLIVNLRNPANWTITNNIIGPGCCGNNASGVANASPECIRIGKPSSTVQNAHDILIRGNTCQFVGRVAADWPSSGYGSAPQADCSNFNTCHVDGFHIWGCITCTIDQNILYGAACQGIFFEVTNASLNQDITITNNVISALTEASCGNASIKINATASGTYAGTWTIAFNSAPGQLILGNGFAGCATLGCTFNLTGNAMRLFVTNGTGNSAGCNGGSPTNVTLNYAYNDWLASSVTNSASCSATDSNGGAPQFTDSSAAPAVTQDMRLTGSPGSADDLVLSAVCTAITTVDFEGTTRPQGSACDAGGDER